MAKKFNSELVFVYVDAMINDLNETEIKNNVTKKIKKFVSFEKKSGYVCNDFSAADGIDYFLNKHKPDCLAVYHRHRNFFKSIYKPGVSKKIVLRSKIPVIILHAADVVEKK